MDTQFRFCDRCAVMEVNFCSFSRLLQLWFCFGQWVGRIMIFFIFFGVPGSGGTTNFGAGDW